MATRVNPQRHHARYSRYFRRLVDKYERSPQVRTSISLLLTLFAISFFTIFALRPTIITILDLFANIRSQEETLEKLDQKVANLNKAQEVWRQEEKRRLLLGQALPTEAEPDHYLRQIEGLTARHGIALHFFRMDKILLLGEEEKQTTKKSTGSTTNTKSFKVVFSVSGDYSSLISLLEELEELRRIIKIESLSFGAGNEGQGELLLLTIAGEVSYYESDK